MVQDLTEGSIGKKLIKYFLPIAAGTMFQQLYNAVDAIIVGKFVGTEALAAVGGSAANINAVLIGFFVALSSGCAVVIAQLFGARDREAMEKATGTAIAFCLIAGAVLTVTGLALTPAMLRLLKTPDNTLTDSALYLRIIFAGVTAQLIYNIEAGILRAVGDSRSPFIYLLVCCAANIVLDLVFVVVFKMAVAGVAIATVISQVLSAVLATLKLCRSDGPYRVSLSRIHIDGRLLSHMMHIGIPAGLQSSMYNISNIILQVGVNMLGTTPVAAWALSGKIDGFYWACANAAGIAVMNFSAQNFGAGKIDRVKDGTKLSLKVFLGVTVAFSALLLTLGRMALPLFTDDAALIADTWLIMRCVVPLYFTWTFIEIFSGVLRGVGDTIKPLLFCGIGICLLRIVWVLTAYRMYPTLFTLIVSYPISWTVTALAFIIYYRRGTWQRRLDTYDI